MAGENGYPVPRYLEPSEGYYKCIEAKKCLEEKQKAKANTEAKKTKNDEIEKIIKKNVHKDTTVKIPTTKQSLPTK